MATASPPTRWAGRALRAASARLRFVAVFAAVSLVVGGWETLRTYWARLTTAVDTSQAGISSGTEYYCPMDPGILSDWPQKCPVCNMALIRRARGEAVPLPSGVMARMQLSPERLWLGGVETAAATYSPMARELELPGVVTSTTPIRVEVELFERERGWVEVGQVAEIEGSSKGVVRSVEAAKAVVEVEGNAARWRTGDRVIARILCPIVRREPFRGQPDAPPTLSPGEPRRLYLCMDHPEVVRDAPGTCPIDRVALMPRALGPDQRARWWCPMHPAVVADKAGSGCEACGGMALVPRVVSYRPPGMVLGVPASSVIDDGARALVYVERGPGMFDGRIVLLGPRCGGSFPVVSGLEPGERVAARGAFLIDAETRLNPSMAAGYFGAGRGASPAAAPPKSTSEAWADGLATADRAPAIRQRTCPVTGKPLGSMGVPPRVDMQGRVVYLCCDGCIPAIQANPSQYLAKLPSVVKP